MILLKENFFQRFNQLSSNTQAVLPRVRFTALITVNVVLFAAEWFLSIHQFQQTSFWTLTFQDRVALIITAFVTFMLLLLWLFTLVKFTTIVKLLYLRLRWLAGNSIRALLSALFLYLLFNKFADLWSTQFSLYRGDLIRSAGFINSAAILLFFTYRHHDHPLPKATASLSRRKNILFALFIIIVAVSMSVWQFLIAPPQISDDSAAYFAISQRIIGHKIDAGLWSAVYSPMYPLVLAVTRTLHDSAASVTLFQHILRALTAVYSFWALRKTHYRLGILAGVLLSLSPLSASYAHMVLTESISSSLILFLLILAFTSIEQQLNPGRILLVGLLCGLCACIRPSNLLIIVPVIVVLFAFTHSWVRCSLIVVSFLITFSIVNLWANTLAEKDISAQGFGKDFYFIGPLEYYNLFDPENGPIAAAYYSLRDRADCNWDAIQKEYSDPTSLRGGVILYDCGRQYSIATGNQLSFGGLFFEAIRAKPNIFFSGVYNEIREFITHSTITPWDRPPTLPILRTPLDIPSYSADPYQKCLKQTSKADQYNPSYAKFGCSDILPHYSNTIWQVFNDWSYTSLLFTQPYRLFSDSVGGRFWGALLLVTIISIMGNRRLLPLSLLCILIILYQAVTVAVGSHNITRYVFVISPVFILLAALLVVTIWDIVIENIRGKRILQNLQQLDLHQFTKTVLVSGFIIVSLVASIWLLTYLSKNILPTPNHRLDTRFNDNFLLFGYDTIQKSDIQTELYLYWQVLQMSQKPHNIFFHMLPPDSNDRFDQVDYPWITWAHPTSTWQTGDIVIQRVTLNSLEPHYRIAFGLYDDSGVRPTLVPNAAGDNSILVTIR